MTVLGIHATATEAAEEILASGFRPGNSLANYLGEGAYFYLVHGDRGYENAVDCAKKVASRRNGKIAVLAAEISVDAALNLQNPVIRPSYAAFGASFDRRLSQLHVHVEPNDNGSYYRPVSHLTIEAFRRCVEAIGGRSFDVLSARFALKSRDIDVEVPHEMCVKRSRAILSVGPCDPGTMRCFTSSDPAAWPCDDGTVTAARNAVRAIEEMDDRDIVDLIVSIYQGSEGCWAEPRPRFAEFGAVHVVFDSLQVRASDAARLVADAGRGRRSLHFVDLARFARLSTANAQTYFDSVIQNTDGLLALLTQSDSDLLSLLVTIAERRPEVPILALCAPGPGVSPVHARMPILLRSRHNLCCLDWPSGRVLGEVVKGFLHDRWTDGLAVLDIESKMAARHGSETARHRDARKIVEAYHARQHNLL